MASVKKPKQGLKQFHIDVISSKKLKHVTLLLPIKLDKIMVPHFTGFWPKKPPKNILPKSILPNYWSLCCCNLVPNITSYIHQFFTHPKEVCSIVTLRKVWLLITPEKFTSGFLLVQKSQNVFLKTLICFKFFIKLLLYAKKSETFHVLTFNNTWKTSFRAILVWKHQNKVAATSC